MPPRLQQVIAHPRPPPKLQAAVQSLQRGQETLRRTPFRNPHVIPKQVQLRRTSASSSAEAATCNAAEEEEEEEAEAEATGNRTGPRDPPRTWMLCSSRTRQNPCFVSALHIPLFTASRSRQLGTGGWTYSGEWVPVSLCRNQESWSMELGRACFLKRQVVG